MTAPQTRSALAFFLSALLAGCGVGVQDQDADRGGATPIKTCGVVTDKVDGGGDDPVDYKLLQVPDTGLLSVTVHWDEPKVEGHISLQDKFGVILERKERNSATNNDNINRTVEPGVYFVQVAAEHGASVYSVETGFKGAGGGGCGADDDPIPVIIELQRKDDGKRKSGGKDSGGRGAAPAAAAAAVPPPPVAPPPAPMPGFGGGGSSGGGGASRFDEPLIEGGGGFEDEFPEPAGAKANRKGPVTRVVETRSGETEVTVALGRGDGVKKGVRGRLVSPGGKPLRGAKLVVVKVYGSACKAKTSYPSDQIPDGAMAVLRTLR